METHTDKKVSSLFKWLVEVLVKVWHNEKELLMPDILWLNVDIGILRLKETAVLE